MFKEFKVLKTVSTYTYTSGKSFKTLITNLKVIMERGIFFKEFKVLKTVSAYTYTSGELIMLSAMRWQFAIQNPWIIKFTITNT